MAERHLLLLDASGFAHRSFHTSAPSFRSDGLPTGMITNFLGILWRLLGAAQADQPTHAFSVFDAPGKTFRHSLFPAYKNNRPARAAELLAQLPYLRHASETMGITPLELGGYEADDLLATLAVKAVERGFRVSIVSSDKDMQQTLREGAVEIIDPMAHARFTEADCREGKFGVAPFQVPAVQALAGDAVDNIPGIKGVGLKSARAFIRTFGSIEGVVGGARWQPHYFTPSQRLRLKAPAVLSKLRLYRHLATLRCDVPLPQEWLESCILQPIMREHVFTLLDKLEARGRFDSIFRSTPQHDRVVAPVSEEEAFAWWKRELDRPGQSVPDVPQCGFFKRRAGVNYPWVPARIWREDEEDFVLGGKTGNQVLRCEIGGEPRDAAQEWPGLTRHPISHETYEYMTEVGRWARVHAPNDPEANPQSKINWNKVSL